MKAYAAVTVVCKLVIYFKACVPGRRSRYDGCWTKNSYKLLFDDALPLWMHENEALIAKQLLTLKFYLSKC